MSKTIFPQSKLVAYTLLVSIFSLFVCNVDGSINNSTGFSIDIFHRDSPLSPTYNSSLTPSQHITNAVKRSIERVRLINSRILNESPYTYILLSEGAYLTSINLGTPQVAILVSVDTGSNVIWTQCKGCKKCLSQDLPFFDPKRSSTYKRVRCGSEACLSIDDTYCDLNDRLFCQYKVEYEDDSVSSGDIAADTLTLRSTDRRLEQFHTVLFGCAYNSAGIFSGQESGILGLGDGPSSLIRQLDYAIEGKFSYCLVSMSSSERSSLLNFGERAIVSGPGTVSTGLFFKEELYFVRLDAVSINNIRLEYTDTLNSSKVNNSKAGRSKGNLLIDNGTTATFLNKIFYQIFVNALKNYLRLRTVADPEKYLDTCFLTKTGVRLVVTFHFRGANVNVRAENLFTRRNANILCLLVLPENGDSVLGSSAQVNILVGFDLMLGKVSFRLTNCAKYSSVEQHQLQSFLSKISEYLPWWSNDQRVKVLLQASLSEDAMPVVLGYETSTDVWTTLENAYSNTSKSRANNFAPRCPTYKEARVPFLNMVEILNIIAINLLPWLVQW